MANIDSDAKASMKFRVIAGPCVIENRDMVFCIAEELTALCLRMGIELIFKASYDKANRSSGQSFRGPGPQEGLAILAEVRDRFNIPVLTDIHESNQAVAAAQAVDVLQIPAFLCRQTDLLIAAARAVEGTCKSVNVKKGQFLAPWDMANIVTKMSENGLKPSSERLWLTERGTSFGYNTLIVDYRSLPQLQSLGCPVIFDATHSVQQPGGMGSTSGGQRQFVAHLARAAVAVGVDGIFMEVHPDPDNALSDGPNMLPIHKLEGLLRQLMDIRSALNHCTAS
ncbi:3-deoxy-8-phosphooctulonate synthase [Synechococcus sp. BS55D]|uniref:3-deoxy-8-phosphooctulonate synthase n=1 Tax=Synechococcus sp. BS55D TaxID=2055943 RepID=UPI001038F005|nr:3-deoxy-8-phosphooctulonate synthase [Synechococcus sp. BS55D]TCD58094.1 3-deoxy-8-phosphooctulonate synthase [Synechococcus sp. BS55D]